MYVDKSMFALTPLPPTSLPSLLSPTEVPGERAESRFLSDSRMFYQQAFRHKTLKAEGDTGEDRERLFASVKIIFSRCCVNSWNQRVSVRVSMCCVSCVVCVVINIAYILGNRGFSSSARSRLSTG